MHVLLRERNSAAGLLFAFVDVWILDRDMVGLCRKIVCASRDQTQPGDDG